MNIMASLFPLHVLVTPPKACGYHLVTFLDRTLIFNRYIVWQGSKSKRHKHTHSTKIGLRLWNIIATLHSTLKTIGRTYTVQSIKRVNRCALAIIITKFGEVPFSIRFCRCFIIGFAKATTQRLVVEIYSIKTGEDEKRIEWHPHTLTYYTIKNLRNLGKAQG